MATHRLIINWSISSERSSSYKTPSVESLPGENLWQIFVCQMLWFSDVQSKWQDINHDFGDEKNLNAQNITTKMHLMSEDPGHLLLCYVVCREDAWACRLLKTSFNVYNWWRAAESRARTWYLARFLWSNSQAPRPCWHIRCKKQHLMVWNGSRADATFCVCHHLAVNLWFVPQG